MTNPFHSPADSDSNQLATQPPGRLPGVVKLLGTVSLLNDIASEMIYPLLPQVLAHAGAGKLGLGLVEGLAETVASLLKLGSAYGAERLGRKKPFLLVGYGLAALARPLLALATASWHVLAIRLLDRVGKGVRAAPRDALIADSTPPELRGRAFGLHRSLDHLGAVLGPTLAAVLLWFWPGRELWVIAGSIIPGTLLCALVLFGLREVPRVPATPGPAPLDESPATRPLTMSPWSLGGAFRWYLAALFLFTLANSSDLFLFQRSYDLGMSSSAGLVLWAAFHVLKTGGAWICGLWSDRYGPRRLILAGWLIYAAVYLGFGYCTSAWQSAALFGGYAAFYSLTEPAERALVASLAPEQQRGLAYGWFHLVVGLGAFPSSLIFGGLYQRFGAEAAFGASTGLALTAALVLGISAQGPASETGRGTLQSNGS